MILVTGATGFVGREVVHRLLRARREIAVLVRSKDGASGTERVGQALGAPVDGLTTVEGDLGEPACGLAPADLRWLRATVETVLHCAGDTTFAPDAPGPYRAVHVDGPRALLEMLASGRLRRWAQVSTAFVCGRRSGTALEVEGDVGQTFHNVYERVKLEAELVLRAAGLRHGIDVRVFRPGIVIGRAPSTAGGHPSNVLFGFIRLAATLARMAGGGRVRVRIEGAPRAPFNLVPVEHVARALPALAEHPAGAGRTFHLVASDPPTQAEMLATIAERLGIEGLALIDARRERLTAPSALERRMSRMLGGYRDYLMQDVRFDDANTRALLATGAAWRTRLTREVVHALIDLALTTGGPARVAAH